MSWLLMCVQQKCNIFFRDIVILEGGVFTPVQQIKIKFIYNTMFVKEAKLET